VLVFLDYDMINEDCARRYCCEDISLIENYAEAIADKTQTWDIHHRAEILPCGRYTVEQLEKHGLYWNVPSSHLIFLTHSEHIRMHNEGRHLSAETRAKLCKPKTAEHRAKLSIAKKGKPTWIKGKHLSEEHRAKISEAHKGKTHSPEARAKMSASHKGKPLSAEHRSKLSAANKGNPSGMKGKHHSPETRAKMSEAAKRRHKR